MTLHSLDARRGLEAHEREIRTCLEGMVHGLAFRAGLPPEDVARFMATKCLEIGGVTEIERDNEKSYCMCSG